MHFLSKSNEKQKLCKKYEYKLIKNWPNSCNTISFRSMPISFCRKRSVVRSRLAHMIDVRNISCCFVQAKPNWFSYILLVFAKFKDEILTTYRKLIDFFRILQPDEATLLQFGLGMGQGSPINDASQQQNSQNTSVYRESRGSFQSFARQFGNRVLICSRFRFDLDE